MSDFVYGFFFPFRCMKSFFTHPKIIVYSIVPMVINLIIYGTIFFYTYDWLTGKAESFITDGIGNQLLYEILRTFMKVITFLLVLVICYLLFVIFGGIISAPFNEKISKYIEEKMFGIRIENNLPFFKDVFLSIREELKKILFYLSVMIPLILIDFIPMIGSVITLVFGSLFSFFYNALDYMDYPMTRRMTGFRKKLGVVMSQKMLSFGFGAMAFFLTFLPVINVLLNPLLVVSGTRLFYEKNYIVSGRISSSVETSNV